MANAFDTIWVTGLLYRLTPLKFPVYPVKTMSSYLLIQTFEMSFHRATYTWRGMQADLDQSGSVSPLSSACAFAQFHVIYLGGWHGRHGHDPHVSAACQLSGILPQRPTAMTDRMEDRHQLLEKPAMFFVRTGRLILKPRPVQLFCKPNH